MLAGILIAGTVVVGLITGAILTLRSGEPWGCVVFFGTLFLLVFVGMVIGPWFLF